jgi:hypothetical protein
MSDEQHEEDLIPGNGGSTPLSRDPAGPEDVLRTESQDGPVADG